MLECTSTTAHVQAVCAYNCPWFTCLLHITSLPILTSSRHAWLHTSLTRQPTSEQNSYQSATPSIPGGPALISHELHSNRVSTECRAIPSLSNRSHGDQPLSCDHLPGWLALGADLLPPPPTSDWSIQAHCNVSEVVNVHAGYGEERRAGRRGGRRNRVILAQEWLQHTCTHAHTSAPLPQRQQHELHDSLSTTSISVTSPHHTSKAKEMDSARNI